MNCADCSRPLAPNEVSAYRNRCEDCWTAGARGGCLGVKRASECYYRYKIVENVADITNQSFSCRASLTFRGQRRKK